MEGNRPPDQPAKHIRKPATLSFASAGGLPLWRTSSSGCTENGGSCPLLVGLRNVWAGVTVVTLRLG